MADQLDKFFNENRGKFDTETPSPKVWEGVRDGLSDGKSQFNTSWYWKAAAITLLFLSTYLLVDKVGNSDTGVDQIVQAVPQQDEFILAEDYYFSLINEKIVEIQESDMDPEIKEDFSTEIDRLDGMYSELQTEYDQVQDDKVKDAMIMNLQLRINILNEQLNIIKDIKNKEQDENTSI